MKHLIIKNLGPLKEADLEIGNLSIIIGTQSSGKSCVLKMACYCSWVEKRIMLTQSHPFYKDAQFIEDFVIYYKMYGYVKADTYISYESPYIAFSYSHDKFTYELKRFYWQYKRPKITYIPTERNVVSMFPEFLSLPNLGNHIQDFMTDYNQARSSRAALQDVLGMGYSYRYDKTKNEDVVTTPDSTELQLTNTSSGLQSMLPLFVHLDYVTEGIYKDSDYNFKNLSIDKTEEVRQLLEYLFKRLGVSNNTKKPYSTFVRLNGQVLKFWFNKSNDKKKFDEYIEKLLYTNHTEIFLEEPENNLFPPTQAVLLDWILDNTIYSGRNDSVFIATHSPYVLSKLLEREERKVHLFFTYQKEDGMYIKTASDEDIREINDYGVDMFFSYETFV